ncbi:MAG: type IV toxin-antitoxin system AbiEi family antitoxin domain-containing protein [Propionicimonas sp.]|nr:type IV toxin-antitoxin system AbiEi family antitoxin domain-containing protein [Propionicimonas sp.]
MHPRQDPTPAHRLLAAGQQGYLTAEQAVRLGLPAGALDRLAAQGHWDRPARGLYDLRPGQDSLDRRVWAAVLLAGEPCAVGGLGALHLLGMALDVPGLVVWVPDDRRPRPASPARIRRDGLDRLARAGGIPPRICAEDALLDACRGLAAGPMVSLLADAIRLRLTTAQRVADQLESRRRVPNRRLIEAILGDLHGVESTLEWTYRRDVERAHRLPEARRQVSLSAGTRSDVSYEGFGVLVELDGRRGHLDAAAAFRDLARDNRHAGAGLITLRYGSADVRGRPCQVARQVWATLVARGLGEPFHPCRRCQTT